MKGTVLYATLILALAGACHDGSGSGFTAPGDSTAPIVELTFPPPVSATDAESITVTGTASDPSGVAEVRVNGVLAVTTDGFATWSAQVLLAPGTNALAVEASDLVGNSDVAAQASIDSQAVLLEPRGISVDPTRQVAFVLDGEYDGVKAVDLLSGIRTRVSDTSHRFFGAFGIALDGNRALIVDRGPPAAVVAVDLVSGAGTILSDDAHGVGPSLIGPLAIAVDVDRALVTTDGGMKAIVAVDLTSGDRTILSSPTVGSGPTFRSAEGIVLDGTRAVVVDRMLPAVLTVDLVTGDRTILSDANTGTGPIFTAYSVGITLDFDRALVSDSGLGVVFAVDLLSGDRTIVSDPFGVPGLPAPTAIALDETDPSRALVADAYLGALRGMDLTSGELTFVTPPTSVGTGPSIAGNALAVHEERLLVGGLDRSLLAVDLATGDRTVVSDASTGNGPQFHSAEAIVVDGDRALVLGLHPGGPDRAIFAVDLASGDRSIVSDPSTGAGPMFEEEPSDIALAGNRLLVADESAVFAVELASGDRTLLFGGLGQFSYLRGIAVDGDRVFLLDLEEDDSTLLELDLVTGERSIVASPTVGAGPILEHATDLILDGDRVLLTARPGTIYSVDLATGDRTALAGPLTGSALGGLSGLAKSGDRVWTINIRLDAVLAVDLRFAQRAIVSR